MRMSDIQSEIKASGWTRSTAAFIDELVLFAIISRIKDRKEKTL